MQQPDTYYVIGHSETSERYIARRYPYTKLKSNDYFRLLKLFPRRGRQRPKNSGQPFASVASLTEYRIEQAPPYECLSYTWGAPEEVGATCVDGRFLGLRHNLSNALKALTPRNKPRYLWIDYLCINQQDLQERSQQVQLMYLIYSRAACVNIYLGEEADGSQHIPNLLQKIGVADKKDTTSRTREWPSNEYVSRGLPPLDDEAWSRLRAFISRPWFTRIWILQESIAARKLVMICGFWSTPAFSIFTNLATAEVRLHSCLRVHPTQQRDVLDESERYSAQLMFMLNRGLAKRSTQNAWSEQALNLLEGLEMTRQAQASDPRDKVFALLNICTGVDDLGIRPNYESQPEEVCEQVGVALVEAGYGGRLLLNAGIANSKIPMPSWTPDWAASQPFKDTLVDTVKTEAYETKKARNAPSQDVRIGQSQHEMLIQSLEVDVFGSSLPCEQPRERPQGSLGSHIDFESHQAQDLQTPFFDASRCRLNISGRSQIPIRELDDHATNLERSSSKSKNDPLYRLLATAYYLVMCSEHYQHESAIEIAVQTVRCRRDAESFFRSGAFNDAPSHLLSAFLGLYLSSSAFSDIEATIRASVASGCITVEYESLELRCAMDVRQGMQGVCNNLRLTCTKSGYVGMVPFETQKRDVLVCAKGVEYPVVIRPVSSDDDARYTVVGAAYFAGFLPGQPRLGQLEESVEYKPCVLV